MRFVRLHAGGLAIRRLRPEDFEAVLALLRQLPGSRASRSREGFARIFQALLDGEGQEAFVATLRHWIVGFVSLYYLDVLHHGGRVASIQELVVTAELRGRGIGRALIEFARARAKERHCTGTELALGLSGLEGRFAYPGRVLVLGV